jgi:ABC-type polysaccharide/polyol phosphate export permease
MLYADFLTFKPMIKTKIIDIFIEVGVTVMIMGHLLTSFGMRADFGLFMAATFVGHAAMFEIYPRAAEIVMDLTSNKVISYDLILPLPSWLAVMRLALTTAIKSLFISLAAFPIGILFVYQQFNPAHFSVAWFIPLLLVSNLFFGFFSLLLSCYIQSIQQLGSYWTRFIFPLWMLGGLQFTWQALYTKSKVLGYLALLNPWLYSQEGMRAVILGEAENLPCWACFTALIIFTTLFAWISVKKMMKRLDCV